jgi:hypothetical protein
VDEGARRRGEEGRDRGGGRDAEHGGQHASLREGGKRWEVAYDGSLDDGWGRKSPTGASQGDTRRVAFGSPPAEGSKGRKFF